MSRTLKSSWASSSNLQFLIGVEAGAVKVFKAIGLNVDDDTGSDNTFVDYASTVQANLTTSGLTFGTNTWNGVTVPVMTIGSGGGITMGSNQSAHHRPSLLGWNSYFIISTSSAWGAATTFAMEDSGYSALFWASNGSNVPFLGHRTINVIMTTGVTGKAMVARSHDTATSNASKLYRCASGGTVSTPSGSEIADGAGFPTNYLHHLLYLGRGSASGSQFLGEIYLIGAFNNVLTSSDWQAIADDPEGYFFDTTGPVLTKKFRIPTTAADGTARKILVYSDSTLGTVIAGPADVTAASGYFKYTSAIAVAGTKYRCFLSGFGADDTVAARGGPAWATGIEE